MLDTWFSSGLWPFSTLGFPDNTEELKYYYPTSTLVTGYDIIFFWVARMIVFGLEAMNEKPFDTVYIHGIVRDSQGRKMSKSLGNGVDPLDIIEKHGADSLRFSLLTGNTAGNDMKFNWEKVEAASNFCNKIYNAARFVLMNLNDIPAGKIEVTQLDISDKWILGRLNDVINEVNTNLDAFELGISTQKVYDFIWSEFCDWYIEMAKPRLYGEDKEVKATVCSVLTYVLNISMQLLHPFMPFITEEIYTHLPSSGPTIMRSEWPKANEAYNFKEEAEWMESAMQLIRKIRNIRAEMDVPPSKKIKLLLVSGEESERLINDAGTYFKRLAGVESLEMVEDKIDIPQNAISIMAVHVEAFIPMEQLVDIEKERERISKEIQRVQFEIERANSKLNNKGFVNKAPENVVNEERAKLSAHKELLKKLQERQSELV